MKSATLNNILLAMTQCGANEPIRVFFYQLVREINFLFLTTPNDLIRLFIRTREIKGSKLIQLRNDLLAHEKTMR